jgi:SAM-dependent methyltransferase
MATARKNKKKVQKQMEVLDRHHLYQMAVQSPDHDAPFFDRVYKKKNGRLPRLLREDFCGTAFLSAEWIRRRPDNEAVGIDLDRATLEWGRRNNIDPLGKEARRVRLINSDVRAVDWPKADVIAALNFSYFVFKDREELLGYFRNARRSLAPGGILVLDIFGGWEAQMEVADKTKDDGYTYTWEQKGIDPVTNTGRFQIHFKVDKGPSLRKAFTYDWRLWTVPEVREALADAGLTGFDLYWEGVDEETGEGDGNYKRIKTAENCPGWNALVVAY